MSSPDSNLHIIGTALESVEAGDIVFADSSGAFSVMRTNGSLIVNEDMEYSSNPKSQDIIGELRASIDSWLAGAIT